MREQAADGFEERCSNTPGPTRGATIRALALTLYRVKVGMDQPIAGLDAKAAQTQNCLGRMQRKQSSDA
jgi:hypothetical protein